MTATEFRKILDRFHVALQAISVWVLMRDPQVEDHPGGLAELDQVWRDLSNHFALMKDAERPCLACEVGSTGGLPGPDDIAVFPSEADANAEQIGRLQARVSQLEGNVKSLSEAIRPVFNIAQTDNRWCALTENGWCVLGARKGNELRTLCGATLEVSKTTLGHGRPDCFVCIGILERERTIGG